MLTDDGKHLYVSWDEYHLLIERLALKVAASKWQFDQILCLARGGMRPGDVLSRVFDLPLAIMSTSSYRAEAGTIQGRLDMAKYITLPRGEAEDLIELPARGVDLERQALDQQVVLVPGDVEVLAVVGEHGGSMPCKGDAAGSCVHDPGRWRPCRSAHRCTPARAPDTGERCAAAGPTA